MTSKVIFKASPKGGMFRHKFRLETTPKMSQSISIEMRGVVIDVVPGTFYDHESIKDQIAKEKTRRYFERLVDGTIRRAVSIHTKSSKLLQRTRRALFENRNTDKGVSLRYHYSPMTWKRCAQVTCGWSSLATKIMYDDQSTTSS